MSTVAFGISFLWLGSFLSGADSCFSFLESFFEESLELRILSHIIGLLQPQVNFIRLWDLKVLLVEDFLTQSHRLILALHFVATEITRDPPLGAKLGFDFAEVAWFHASIIEWFAVKGKLGLPNLGWVDHEAQAI
jgi:hypothetical protein